MDDSDRQIIAALRADQPEIRAIYSTNGRWDAILEIGVETLEE